MVPERSSFHDTLRVNSLYSGVVLGNLLGPFLQFEAAVKAAPCGSVWLALHMDLPRALENRVNE